MKSSNATDAKNQFGRLLESALVEPVAIRKSGRNVAVVVSWGEYERLTALEDAMWARQAQEAERAGYLGPAATRDFLRRKLRKAHAKA